MGRLVGMGKGGGEEVELERGEVQKMFMMVKMRRESIGLVTLVWGGCGG